MGHMASDRCGHISTESGALLDGHWCNGNASSSILLGGVAHPFMAFSASLLQKWDEPEPESLESLLQSGVFSKPSRVGGRKLNKASGSVLTH